MTTKTTLIIGACALLAMAGLAQAPSGTGTTTLSVAVGAEAALTVNTSSTSLTTASTTFGNPYTGTTSLTYFMRTGKSTGTGTLTLRVTADFSPAGGPLVATPPSTGDALTYSPTVSSPGTAATGPITATTTTQTAVGSWGAAASSTKAGNTASVAWSLTDDPVYNAGSTYTATTTFTISAT